MGADPFMGGGRDHGRGRNFLIGGAAERQTGLHHPRKGGEGRGTGWCGATVVWDGKS